jgi:phage terminase Nu1 subunit (DNA packaging protein)
MTETVTAATLARYFGCTPRAIGDLVKRKLTERSGAGFDLEDCTRRAMTHYRNLAQSHGGEVDVGKAAHERARLAAAQTALVETKQRKLAGTLVDAAEVEAEWSGVLRTVHAGCLAIPSRCAQRLPHLSAHDLGEIDAEVRAALTDVSNLKQNAP